MSTARYVVEHVTPALAYENGTWPAHEIRTYWYGPDRGFGTTSGGPDDLGVVTFPNLPAAERALRKVWRSVAESKRRGYRIVRDSRGAA